MHIRILPQVERREMKTESVDGADQPAERTAAGEQSPSSLRQRIGDGNQVRPEGGRVRIGTGVKACRAGGFAPRGRPIGGCQASVDAAQRAAIRLIIRSAEHTSELQSLMRNLYAVLCFKKK